jgi:hypothetical protein
LLEFAGETATNELAPVFCLEAKMFGFVHSVQKVTRAAYD